MIAGHPRAPARNALLTLGACAAAGWLVAPAAVLMAAPALALTLALVAGWMPGEPALSRWRARGMRPRRRCAPWAARVAAAHASARRPGGRIVICFSLANRPPPLPAPAG